MLQILTLSWQGVDKLRKLYKSLMPALEGLEWSWFIKDNGSTDGSVEEVRSWENTNIHLTAYPHNRDNYSMGMNFLFKEANPNNQDLVLTLNNDVVIKEPQSLRNMIKLMKNDIDIGLVGAKLSYSNTNIIQHCGVLFHPRYTLPFHYRSGAEEQERDCINRYYPIVTGAVALTRGDIFRELMFNEKFFWAFEDCDFAMRINHHLKKKVVYCGETNIEHEESASLKKNPVNKMFLQSNCQLFMQDWRNHIDTSLVEKYGNPKFNVYSKDCK